MVERLLRDVAGDVDADDGKLPADEKVAPAPADEKTTTNREQYSHPEAIASKAAAADDEKLLEDQDGVEHAGFIGLDGKVVAAPTDEIRPVKRFEDTHYEGMEEKDFDGVHLTPIATVDQPMPIQEENHEVPAAVDFVTGAQLTAQDERIEDGRLGAHAGKVLAEVGAGKEEEDVPADDPVLHLDHDVSAAVDQPIQELHIGGQEEQHEVPADDRALHPEHDVSAAVDAVEKSGTCVTGAQLMAPDERGENNKLGGAGKVVVEEDPHLDDLSGDKAGPSGNGTDHTAPPERVEQDGLDALGGMVLAHVTGVAQNNPEERVHVASAEVPASDLPLDRGHDDDDDEDPDHGLDYPEYDVAAAVDQHIQEVPDDDPALHPEHEDTEHPDDDLDYLVPVLPDDPEALADVFPLDTDPDVAADDIALRARWTPAAEHPFLVLIAVAVVVCGVVLAASTSAQTAGGILHGRGDDYGDFIILVNRLMIGGTIGLVLIAFLLLFAWSLF